MMELLLKKSEMKDIKKVVKSLEKRLILWKETTKKLLNKKKCFSIFSTALVLMKNILTILAKSVLISLGLTAAASETGLVIPKKTFESATAAWIISNNKKQDIKQRVKS